MTTRRTLATLLTATAAVCLIGGCSAQPTPPPKGTDPTTVNNPFDPDDPAYTPPTTEPSEATVTPTSPTFDPDDPGLPRPPKPDDMVQDGSTFFYGA